MLLGFFKEPFTVRIPENFLIDPNRIEYLPASKVQSPFRNFFKNVAITAIPQAFLPNYTT
jgi:hypothetical protein